MHFKPKKRLGQHFLVDKNIQKKILDHLELKGGEVLLEIGAGRGELTRWVADKVKKVYALEVDAHLCSELRNLARTNPHIKVIQQDILEFDFNKKFLRLKNKVKVLGNIPYYISTPIIEYLLNCRDKIDSIFMTVQKEFAERIVASAGSKAYASLSCFVQYYTHPQILFTVRKGCFFPAPKVDSSFIRLKIRPKPMLQPEDEKLLFRVIRTAFSQRRKTLRNSLAGLISKDSLERFFSLSSKDRNIRPEQLALEDFINLTKIV